MTDQKDKKRGSEQESMLEALVVCKKFTLVMYCSGEIFKIQVTTALSVFLAEVF